MDRQNIQMSKMRKRADNVPLDRYRGDGKGRGGIRKMLGLWDKSVSSTIIILTGRCSQSDLIVEI